MDVEVTYGCTSVKLGRKKATATHEWRVYFNASNKEDESILKNAIESVHFKLHPDFATPLRSVATAPFVVNEEGWGEFDIEVTLRWKKRKGQIKENANKHYITTLELRSGKKPHINKASEELFLPFNCLGKHFQKQCIKKHLADIKKSDDGLDIEQIKEKLIGLLNCDKTEMSDEFYDVILGKTPEKDTTKRTAAVASDSDSAKDVESKKLKMEHNPETNINITTENLMKLAEKLPRLEEGKLVQVYKKIKSSSFSEELACDREDDVYKFFSLDLTCLDTKLIRYLLNICDMQE